MPDHTTGSPVVIVLPTVEELCEAMAATGDRPGFTVTRDANGYPRFAAAVLELLEARRV